MRKHFLTLLPFALLIAFGCNPEPDAKAAPSTTASTTAEKPKASESSNPTIASTAGAATPEKPAGSTATASGAQSTPPATGTTTTPAAAPVDFKHDGFEYSGAGNTKPIDMELTMSTKPEVITGSQTVTLKESKAGTAVYNVDRSGGLANLGTEEWTVTKDGVFTTKSSVMDIGDKAMELPADPKPGMTWKVHTKSSTPEVKMDMEITFKIIGKQKVTTKAGTHEDALLVEQDGVGTIQNDKVRTVSQNWYVKGIGVVKATMKTVRPNGKTESLTIQETKSQ